MRRFALGFIAGVLGMFLLAAGEAKHVLHFPEHEFSITPLEGQGDGMFLSMSLPPVGGFASNVNVIAQTYPGTLDAYLATSNDGLAKLGATLIKCDKTDAQTAILEYSGKLGGQKLLHFYAKAIQKGDKVILATGTSTDDNWPKVSDSLKACVDSAQRDAAK